MSANGLPTPDSTPGSDPDRIAADKCRQESEKTKPSAFAPKARQESEKTKPSASAPKARQESEKNALVTKPSDTAKGKKSAPKNGEQVSVQSKLPYDEEVEEDAPMPDADQQSISVNKPSASARTEEPALPTVPENGKQTSVEPPSDEAVVQDAAMPDASSNDIDRQQRHREAITRVLNARRRYYDVLDLKPSSMIAP